jgi:hypothetical protein
LIKQPCKTDTIALTAMEFAIGRCLGVQEDCKKLLVSFQKARAINKNGMKGRNSL